MPDVFQVPFRSSPALSESVSRLSHTVGRPGRPDPVLLESVVVATAVGALGEALGVAPSDALATRRKRSTREELVARVIRARDLIHDTKGRASLSQMAFEADLSKYHFLRVFEAVYGVTPAKYALDVRLDRGQRRLDAGDPPSIAARVAGYASASSFLRALRRRNA